MKSLSLAPSLNADCLALLTRWAQRLAPADRHTSRRRELGINPEDTRFLGPKRGCRLHDNH